LVVGRSPTFVDFIQQLPVVLGMGRAYLKKVNASAILFYWLDDIE
jgi:hypothetical protein